MKSDLTKIPSELAQLAVVETIEEQLQSKNYEISVDPATKETDLHFTGIIYRVTFGEGTEAKKRKLATSSIILKVAPQHLARRNQFNARPCFIREIYVYDKILPAFREFEQSKGVNIEENGFTEYPKCYRTVDVDVNECLLLEDLAIRNFSTIDRQTGVMTADHVNLVMQGLAKFHAVSFALKDQHPKQFDELTSKLNEVIFLESNIQLRFYLSEHANTVLKAVAAEKELLAKVAELYKTEATDIAMECIDLQSTGSASVITYGDVWQTNVMFNYDSNGKPIEVSFVDWQITRHASPVLDIAFFIFCSTSKELRDTHYDQFLKTYHESLSDHIRRLGSDPEKLFPYDLMLDHFRKFAKFGLMMASVVLPVITCENGYKPDFEAISEDVENGTLADPSEIITESSLKRLNKRLRDIVYDMVKLNYI